MSGPAGGGCQYRECEGGVIWRRAIEWTSGRVSATSGRRESVCGGGGGGDQGDPRDQEGQGEGPV